MQYIAKVMFVKLTFSSFQFLRFQLVVRGLQRINLARSCSGKPTSRPTAGIRHYAAGETSTAKHARLSLRSLTVGTGFHRSDAHGRSSWCSSCSRIRTDVFDHLPAAAKSVAVTTNINCPHRRVLTFGPPQCIAANRCLIDDQSCINQVDVEQVMQAAQSILQQEHRAIKALAQV
jgi:hypothetical protein